MSADMTAHERKNSQLVVLFDELLRKRPDLLEEIPSGVALIMKIEGDEEFNEWARRITEQNSPERPHFHVRFTFKRRVRPTARKSFSWEHVEELELQPA